jgi:hypothetical protein
MSGGDFNAPGKMIAAFKATAFGNGLNIKTALVHPIRHEFQLKELMQQQT